MPGKGSLKQRCTQLMQDILCPRIAHARYTRADDTRVDCATPMSERYAAKTRSRVHVQTNPRRTAQTRASVAHAPSERVRIRKNASVTSDRTPG